MKIIQAAFIWLLRLVLCLGLAGSASLAAASPGLQGGTPLVFGEAVSGTLDDDVFREVYMFVGQADDIIAIRMDRLDGDLDPFLLLTDEQGNILAISDDNGTGTDALIASKRLPLDGRYFVIATRFGQEQGSTSGQYELLLEHVGAGVSETTILRYGESVIGRVTADRPLMFYVLRARRGDVISVTMRRTSGDLDPRLDLATADGIVLVSNDDDPAAAGSLDAGIRDYTVRATGVYLILATRFGYEAGDTEGSYVLTLTRRPLDELGTSPEEARLIDYGMTIEGVLTDDVPARYYRFDGERGDVITVIMNVQSGNLDPFVQIVDVNLFGMVQSDSVDADRDARIVAYTLPATGTYYIVATGDEAATGLFTLQLTGRPGIVGGQALEIMYDAAVSGTIDDQNSFEEYIFFGRQGDVIRVSMERASGDLDPLVTLLDSDRKQVAFDDDSGRDQNALLDSFELPRDGMYILVAARYEREFGTTSGAYLLSLELIEPGSGADGG